MSNGLKLFVHLPQIASICLIVIDKVMQIELAITDEQIQLCYPVIQALRPHLQETEFVSRVRAQAQNGYALVRVSYS